jgi:hypothetical protein
MLRLFLLAALVMAGSAAHAQDSDHDGLPDTFEQALLQRFQPTLLIAHADCAGRPARFEPGISVPTVQSQDGTIYGQAFPRHPGEIELHFYHLWQTDCGRMGHPLDTEHVSALLRGSGEDASNWKAVYWYAAAHEDTVCDASQVTRASTLHAVDHGPQVWISAGKHASFLQAELCHHGCGGDRCEQMETEPAAQIVNLGEVTALANESVFVPSRQWPLAQKMSRTDFRPALLQRVDGLPATDIAWAEPAKRPGQATILGANRGVDGALTGSGAGAHGAAVGTRQTDVAISVAASKTGGTLEHGYTNVRHALGTAARHTRKAIIPTATNPAKDPPH